MRPGVDYTCRLSWRQFTHPRAPGAEFRADPLWDSASRIAARCALGARAAPSASGSFDSTWSAVVLPSPWAQSTGLTVIALAEIRASLDQAARCRADARVRRPADGPGRGGRVQGPTAPGSDPATPQRYPPSPRP